jgi:hypothetical protein
MNRLLLVLITLWLAGCGYVGDPLPPSLKIPLQVEDVKAREIGDKIVVDFTAPLMTTDGIKLENIQAVEVFVGPMQGEFSRERWEQGAKSYPVTAELGKPAHAELPARDFAGKEVAIGVRTRGPKGRASNWSNLVPLMIVAPLVKPAEVKAEPVADGVKLTWKGSAPSYRIYRSQEKAEPQPIGETNSPEYVDQTAAYGTEYRYRVEAFQDKAISEGSETISITPVDIFPPPVPAALAALVSPGSIELSWEPVSARDLRGYRVYRAPVNGEFQVIAEMVNTPAFSDRKLQAGAKYRYVVTAIDQAGNESPRSAPVEATAP